MWLYLLKRLVLLVPTLLLILLLNFFIISLAPGGPVAHKLDAIHQQQLASYPAIIPPSVSGRLSEEMAARLTVQYGLDKPAPERFWQMLMHYGRLDFGESLFRGQTVTALIAEKLPISLLLAVLSLLLTYAIAVPLGVYKALHDGSTMDKVSAFLLSLLHAMPMFVFALLLLLLFAGGQFWRIFPLQGATSEAFWILGFWGRVQDLLWHLSLPVIASSVGGLASVCYLVKFAFLEAWNKSYTVAALGLGLEGIVLYRQVFKNASLVLVSTLPAVAMTLISGNLLIEVVFGIDGMGLLAFDALRERDYPVIFGLLFLFSLVLMLAQLLADLGYYLLNPRLDFKKLGV